MDMNTLFAEFRALGGIADNVTLRSGIRGRGLFAIDPAKPVRLLVPPNLLVRCDDTEIENGRLVATASSPLGARERLFFETYQEHLSWGAGVYADLWQEQLAWNQLPQDARKALSAMWPMDPKAMVEPSEQSCHWRYLNTRMIKYGGDRVLMPILELVNHGSHAAPYDRTEGISVGGKFADEVLASYGSDDCWGTAVNYGFCDARNYAYAVQGAFKFEDHTIRISRAPGQAERHNGLQLPIVRLEGESIHFSFLVLGNKKFPHLPRAAFLQAAKSMPISKPDALFDLTQRHNRHLMLGFLRGSESCAAVPLVTMLRQAAFQQLETLSCH